MLQQGGRVVGRLRLGLWRFNGVTYAPNDNSFLRNLFAISEKSRVDIALPNLAPRVCII